MNLLDYKKDKKIAYIYLTHTCMQDIDKIMQIN